MLTVPVTQEPHSKPRLPRLRRFLIRLWWLVVAIFLITRAIHWWCEAWWFAANGYASLYNTMFGTQCVMFVIGAGLYGGMFWLHIRRARAVVAHSATLPAKRNPKTRVRPPLLPPADKAHIDRYRDWILGSISVLAAWLAGLYGALHWIHLPRFFGANAMLTGQRDPIFERDLSFYLFQLPALNFAWGLIYGAGICALLVSLLIYSYEGILELAGARPQLATVALPHLARLAAGLLIWKALGYSLQGFNLLSRPGGGIYGIGSVEQVWALPVLRLLPWLAVGTAIYLWWLSTRPPKPGAPRQAFIALALFFGASFLLGNAIPAVLQRTDPLDSLRNSSYLQIHARWTRQAYGLENVQETYPKTLSTGIPTTTGTPTGTPTTTGAPTTANNGAGMSEQTLETLPLWSPDTLERFLKSRAATAASDATWRISRPHLDRYRINGEWRPVFVATRTLDPASRSSASWQNRHFVTANGDGIVVYDARRTDATGHPLLYRELSSGAADVTKKSFLYGDFETPVRPGSPFANAGRQPGEPAFSADSTLPGGRSRQQSPFDAPGGPLPANESAWERNTLNLTRTPFDYFIRNSNAGLTPGTDGLTPGTDGPAPGTGSEPYDIRIGSRWRQWILGWRFGDLNLALSSQVTPDHHIDWHYDVVERCRTLLPFLNFAGAPLPVQGDDGRLVWLVDGFTITNSYPYARPLNGSGGINYLRHSVTATVDAGTGQVSFYVIDASEPFTRLYRRFFPDLLHPLSAMPGDIRAHLRYPLLQLAAQAEIWARYHSSDSKILLQPEADWSTLDLADDPFRFLHPNQIPSNYVVRPTSQGPELLSIWSYTRATPTQIDISPRSRNNTNLVPNRPLAAVSTTPTVVAFLMGSFPVTNATEQHSTAPRSAAPLKPYLTAWTAPHPVPLPSTFSRLARPQAANPTALLRQAEYALPLSIALLPQGQTVLGARADHEPKAIEGTTQPLLLQQQRYLVASPQIQVMDRSAQAAANTFQLRHRALTTVTTHEASTRSPSRDANPRLQRARELYRRMQEARRRRDWAAYGVLEEQLGTVLEAR